MPKPNARMGDWVHYHFQAALAGSMVTMPALVTSVIPGSGGRRVTLTAFHPSQGVLHLGHGVDYEDAPTNERWSWPPE